MCDLTTTLAAIDRANAADPSDVGGKPRAYVQGRRASDWLHQLAPVATHELQLATRAHHLRRWEIARCDFATGRRGYLQWRRVNKEHQATALTEILEAHDWPHASIEQACTLLRRSRLTTDADTQALQDAACLVFLETQFDDLIESLDHDHMVNVVARTLTKMSARAITLSHSIVMSPAAHVVLSAAVTSLNAEDSP